MKTVSIQEVARSANPGYRRAMLARFLLALLLAAFATPAAAASPCHDAPAAAMMNHHQAPAPAPDPDNDAVAHVCIGCVPLADRMANVAGRALPGAPAPEASVARIDLGGSSAPALPPPRIG